MPPLPLFPLPVVLLPGMRIPLHIFEPGYRSMLRDALEGDRSFGLVYQDDDAGLRDFPEGTVLCRAVMHEGAKSNGRGPVGAA